MSLNSSGFILVKIELMSQTTTIKAEPYKTLLEIKNKSLKILNDSKKNNLHLFYKNKDLITKEHEQIGNVFPKREKVFLTLMGPLNNPNYIKKKINEINKEIKKHHFIDNEINIAQNLNENNNEISSSNISDDNNRKNNNIIKNNNKNNENNDNNDDNNHNENEENQRKEGKKISIINHKIVTKNKMIFSLMDNNKNKDYDNINEQYKIKHKKNSNNKDNTENNHDITENDNNENNINANNNNSENNDNSENNEIKNKKKLKFNIDKFSMNEDLDQKNKILSPMKSTRNPIKKKLFLKTFNLTNNDNSNEKSQNNSLNDIKNNTVIHKSDAPEKEEKKETEEDLQTKLNKRQEFNRLVKKSLTTKNFKKKSIDKTNHNNNNKDSNTNNNENNNKSPFNKNNFKSENKLAFNSILKSNILSTNTITNNNTLNNINNNNKDNKNKSTNSLQDFSNILTRTNKIKPSFLKSINQEINSMNFMCNCNNNKISFYCRICQDFLCYKCRESFNHQDHLAINIDIKNIENNISLYAIIIQNDIEEKILCNKKYYKSFKENKNYLYTENKNKILESKIKILTNIYNKLFGKLQDILKTKFVDEVEMILNEYNLNAKIIGGKIINILKQIEVFKQNKDKKKLTYEEFQKFFKILNEKEKELNNLEDNILLYKVNYELNEKLIRFYDNIERQLNLLININTPFNLIKKYIDFLKNINKIKYNNNNNLSNYYTNYTTNFSTFNNLNGFNNKNIQGINKINNNNNNSPNNTNNVNNFAFENEYEKFENDELFDEEFIKMNFINFDEENDENKITINNKKNSILLNSLNNLNNKKIIKNKGIFKKNAPMKLEKKLNTKKSLSPIDPNRNIEGKEKIINNSHINLTLSSPLKKKNFNKSEKINIKKI